MTWALAIDDAKYEGRAEGRAEGRTEGRTEGIKILAKQLRKCGQSYEFIKDSIMEEYPDINETLIDHIIEEVCQIENV